jgi:hypothetical protein
MGHPLSLTNLSIKGYFLRHFVIVSEAKQSPLFQSIRIWGLSIPIFVKLMTLRHSLCQRGEPWQKVKPKRNQKRARRRAGLRGFWSVWPKPTGKVAASYVLLES